MNEEIIKEVINLIENKKIKQLREFLDNINEADFPKIFEELDEEKVIMVYRLLSKEKAAEVFVELDTDDEEKLINCLTDREIKNVMNEIFMDDAVDLIEEMPSNVVKRILANTKIEDRKIINELLKYPEDTAGTIMTTEFMDLKEDMTVKDAFIRIKKKGLRSETVYNSYVLSSDRKLLGMVDIKSLLIADRQSKVKDIMETNIIKAQTLDDQEEIVKLFDSELKVMDVLWTAEDFEVMAAMSPTEDSYFKTSVFTHAKNRIVWLLVLMISAMLTGGIIANFEESISALPILVSFIPMLMGTGGNCGSQSSTLIIRGLATDEIPIKDWAKAIWKELRVSIIVGIVLAIINTARITIQYHDFKIALVVSITLVFTVIVAKILGCVLPILSKKLKMDPAIMAAPLLTTLVDATTVLIFFSIVTTAFAI